MLFKYSTIVPFSFIHFLILPPSTKFPTSNSVNPCANSSIASDVVSIAFNTIDLLSALILASSSAALLSSMFFIDISLASICFSTSVKPCFSDSISLLTIPICASYLFNSNSPICISNVVDLLFHDSIFLLSPDAMYSSNTAFSSESF